MVKRDHDHGTTKLSHAFTWSAFDHASHALQVRACNYYLHPSTHSTVMLTIYTYIYINNDNFIKV